MPTQTTSKQKIVTQLFATMAKHVKNKPIESRPVLEQLIYAILRENATRESADQAFEALRGRFFDWNEVRVTSTLEIIETFNGALSDAEARAQRIVDLLQEIFETTYSFDLEPLLEVLQKKGMKQAAKQLMRFQAANDYAAAWVMQQSLGGHVIPLDSTALRVLKRMGMIEELADLEAIRASIENQIPKAKGSQFVDLISVLADLHCLEQAPRCSACPLRTACPTGQEAKAHAAPTMKKPR